MSKINVLFILLLFSSCLFIHIQTLKFNNKFRLYRTGLANAGLSNAVGFTLLGVASGTPSSTLFSRPTQNTYPSPLSSNVRPNVFSAVKREEQRLAAIRAAALAAANASNAAKAAAKSAADAAAKAAADAAAKAAADAAAAAALKKANSLKNNSSANSKLANNTSTSSKNNANKLNSPPLKRTARITAPVISQPSPIVSSSATSKIFDLY
jgi:hypothetical protein